jgi:hypothetical protein
VRDAITPDNTLFVTLILPVRPAARTPGRVPAGRAGRVLARPRRQVSPRTTIERRFSVGSVIKKRRKRMAKKKHRKLLKKTRVQRRNKK